MERLLNLLISSACLVFVCFSCGDSDSSSPYSLAIQFEAVLDSAAYQSTFVGDILPADDGGVLVAFRGHTDSDNDACLARLESNGSVRWQYDYTGSASGGAASLTAVSDSTCAMASYLAGSGSNTVLTEITMSGDSLWQRPIGYIYFNSTNVLTRLSNGDFLVTGRSSSVSSDQMIVRMMPDGQVMWSRTAIEDGLQDVRAAVETDDGGLMFARISNLFDDNEADVEILRTNADGDEMWTRDFGLPLADIANALVRTGNRFVFGGFAREASGGDYLRIVAVDSGGREAWRYIDRRSDRHNGCYDLAVAANGDILVAGYDLPRCCGQTGNLLLIRLSPDGELIWRKTLGTYDLSYTIAIEEASDGDIFVAFDNGNFAHVLKLRVRAGLLGIVAP